MAKKCVAVALPCLVLRNVNSGAFEVYDIANSQITGAASLGSVGLEWQLGGFGAEPPAGDQVRSANSCAMAGFDGGSGAVDGLNAAPLTADTSQ